LIHNRAFVWLARTIYIYIPCICVYTVFWAGKSPNIRSYTMFIYGVGQPYAFAHVLIHSCATAAHAEESKVTLMHKCTRSGIAVWMKSIGPVLVGSCALLELVGAGAQESEVNIV
jgi:hypothetical protein